jgi:hypothetical protein
MQYTCLEQLMIALAVLLVPLVVSIVICGLIFRTSNPRSSAGRARPRAVAAPMPMPSGVRIDADSDALPGWTPLDDIQLDRLLKDASSGGPLEDR